MKKIFIFIIISSCLFSAEKKTVIVSLADAYPLRYNYHKKFAIDRHDVACRWLCRGTGSFRFQHSIHSVQLASQLFDTPLVATIAGDNNSYNAGVLGLGFKECNSVSQFEAEIMNDFLTAQVEIGKVDSPFYLQIGIPIQRSEHQLSMKEKITTDKQVIKGGFAQEYQSNAPVNFQDWQNTPSSIITALPGMKAYLSGRVIGDMEARVFGLLSDCPMVLWALSDIYIQLGYDGCFLKNTSLGSYIRGVIPTSPSLKAAWNRYIFYPVLGNANRAELGVGINGETFFLNDDSQSLELCFDGYVGFLFSAEHMRPYDLKNGFFSRYGGCKVFDFYSLTYKNRFLWGVDLTTQCANIGNSLKSEFVFDFIYQKYQSFFNLGYSFKSQAKENGNCQNKNFFIRQNNAYGFSSQQYVQTPNPNQPNTWTSTLITPDSSMTAVGKNDVNYYNQNELNGNVATASSVLNTQSINSDSALMNTQIINIFFAGYNYEYITDSVVTKFGIKGGVGISPVLFYTPEFYEFLVTLELLY